VFTSMGKNVITATTAVFDGQSEAEHITMIGAIPTIAGPRRNCQAAEGLAEERVAMPTMATTKPAPQPIA